VEQHPFFPDEGALVGTIVLVLVVALALATLVIVYAAYPYRGQETPVSPRVGRALKRGVESMPTIEDARAGERSQPSRT
jgi:hypothetical protein